MRLGSQGRVHHGTLNAILLPHALRFNREAAGPRMADLAGRLGLGSRRGCGGPPGHPDGAGSGTHASSPPPGPARGAERDRIAEYARLAMLDHCHRTNPRPVPKPTWKTCSIGPGDARRRHPLTSWKPTRPAFRFLSPERTGRFDSVRCDPDRRLWRPRVPGRRPAVPGKRDAGPECPS